MGVGAKAEREGAGGGMEALRKQASKFKEQVAKQQQVRIPHPNTLMLPCASRFFLLPVREENGRDLASFSFGQCVARLPPGYGSEILLPDLGGCRACPAVGSCVSMRICASWAAWICLPWVWSLDPLAAFPG